MSHRIEQMKKFAKLAKDAHEWKDELLRKYYSNAWFGMATESDIKRAPAYLTWNGRY